MLNPNKKTCLSLIISLMILATIVSVVSAQTTWYKGNTHAHTLNSDGDSTPDEVARWYRSHGYQFLVLTDHNHLTSVDGLNALMGADDKFIIIKGEEVTDRFGDKPVHINGLDVDFLVEPSGGRTMVETIQGNVDGIRKANGIPHINHPNFGWAFSTDQLLQIERCKLFELYNGHPAVNNEGGGDTPGLESVWDRILSSGKLMYGIAVDDAHHFKRPWDPTAAQPGQGWIYVKALSLNTNAIMAAIEAGYFYSSTGVELEDYQMTGTRIILTIKEKSWAKYRVLFIGKDGEVLKETTSNPAQYTFTGGEMYVRAKVIESSGKVAWTQPVMR